MKQFYINHKKINVNAEIKFEINAKNRSVMTLKNVYFADNNPQDIQFIPDYSYLQYKDGNETLFEGVVKMTSSSEASFSEKVKTVNVRAYDFKDFLSTSQTISAVFIRMQPADVIKQIYEQADIQRYGFVIGNLNFKTDERINL